jgi:hypothetical protein
MELLQSVLFAPPVKEVFYLDPGSGSFILQLIIASAAGALFMLRGYIKNFFNLFRRSDSKDKEESSSSDDAE